MPITIIPFVAVLGATFAVALHWALGRLTGRQRTRSLVVAIGVTVAAAYPAWVLASYIALGLACA